MTPSTPISTVPVNQKTTNESSAGLIINTSTTTTTNKRQQPQKELKTSTSSTSLNLQPSAGVTDPNDVLTTNNISMIKKTASWSSSSSVVNNPNPNPGTTNSRYQLAEISRRRCNSNSEVIVEDASAPSSTSSSSSSSSSSTSSASSSSQRRQQSQQQQQSTFTSTLVNIEENGKINNDSVSGDDRTDLANNLMSPSKIFKVQTSDSFYAAQKKYEYIKYFITY